MTIKKSVNANAIKQIESISGEALTLGTLLSAIRKGEEMSQVTFAEALGVSKQYLCDVEKGRKFISVKAATRFAKILGYSEKYFIKLCLQDMLDREGINLTVKLQEAA